jgi:hypothetical protein
VKLLGCAHCTPGLSLRVGSVRERYRWCKGIHCQMQPCCEQRRYTVAVHVGGATPPPPSPDTHARKLMRVRDERWVACVPVASVPPQH